MITEGKSKENLGWIWYEKKNKKMLEGEEEQEKNSYPEFYSLARIKEASIAGLLDLSNGTP